MIIEKATYKDVNQIQDLMYPTYFEESIYKSSKYDPVRTRMTITEWLGAECYVAKDGDRVAGVFAMFFAYTFYQDLETDVMMFFVHPNYRKTEVARMLLNKLVEVSDNAGSKKIYTSCASGISEKNNQLYMNLFKKFNFEVLGTELLRMKNE